MIIFNKTTTDLSYGTCLSTGASTGVVLTGCPANAFHIWLSSAAVGGTNVVNSKYNDIEFIEKGPPPPSLYRRHGVD